MGHRTAQDHGMQHAVRREIVDVLAAPAQEAQILDALNRSADKGIALSGVFHPARASLAKSRSSSRLYGLRRQRATYDIWLSSNDLEIRLRRLIRIAAMLLPIAQRPKRDSKGLGEFGLRHV